MFGKKKKSAFLLEIEYLTESSRAKAEQETEQFLEKIRKDIRHMASLGRHELTLQFKDSFEAARDIKELLKREGFIVRSRYNPSDAKIIYLNVEWS